MFTTFVCYKPNNLSHGMGTSSCLAWDISPKITGAVGIIFILKIIFLLERVPGVCPQSRRRVKDRMNRQPFAYL